MQALTERLAIRPMQPKDAADVYRYRNLPEVSRYQGWTPEHPDEVSQHAVAMQQRDFAQSEFWWQLVIEKVNKAGEPRQLIGDLAFCIDAERQQAELGIALDPAFQHQGFASEATRGLASWLFSQQQLHRIHVSIDPENTASIRLFDRIGFRSEGLLKKSVWFKGQWCDDYIMAILVEEWPTQV